MDFYYSFPAVKGKQADNEYYISMVPLNLLEKLFATEDEYINPEYRAQRIINESRIPEIKNYILENRCSYVFSALSASIDGDFEFISENNNDLGILQVDMNSKFLINDGQHRKAAIMAAINEDQTLSKETISIVFFKDKGLKKSQQMFTDLNKHAVRTSNSLSTLYDSRDEIAVITKETIDKIPFLKKYTDKEKDILGKNSSKLFTLNTVYKSNLRILHSGECNKNDAIFLEEFWMNVVKNITEWQELERHEITKKDLRENYIITLAVTMAAFGKLGRLFYDNRSLEMKNVLKKLNVIDWSRTSINWINNTIREDGKVLNSEEAINKTFKKIKELIGI